MSDEEKKKAEEAKAAKAKGIDIGAWDAAMVRLGEAAPADRAAIIAADAVLFAAGGKLARTAARQGLPLYSKACDWGRESTVLSLATAAKDAVLATVAGVVVWKAARFAYFWVKGP